MGDGAGEGNRTPNPPKCSRFQQRHRFSHGTENHPETHPTGILRPSSAPEIWVQGTILDGYRRPLPASFGKDRIQGLGRLAEEFEYDVAFSFCALDEGVAAQLNDLLSPRLKTFIYSERQREIAGTDGQESFSQVYGKIARLSISIK